MAGNTVILPIRLDSYGGEKSALEAYLFEDKEEYANGSIPDENMWIAVYIVNGKIDHSLTEYGYKSLEEILKAHKKEKIIGLQENGKDAETEEARAIAEDALGVLIDEDRVLLHVEGELNLPDGALVKAFRTLQKARKGGGGKRKGIDQDEVFYSLCNEDILEVAKELGVPLKRLTPEVIKKIQEKVNETLGSSYEAIHSVIKGEINEKRAAAELGKICSDIAEAKEKEVTE